MESIPYKPFIYLPSMEETPLTDEELRLECLRLACGQTGDTVKIATEFYSFIKGYTEASDGIAC